MNTFLISLPCTDENAAQLAQAWLIAAAVDVHGVDGRNVLVPTNNPPFAFDIAQELVDNGFAHDHEAATAAANFADRNA